MNYIEQHYPDIYKEVRHRPDVGNIGYSKGYNRARPLIKLAKQMDTTDYPNDPHLRNILSVFIKFDKDFTIFSSAIIICMMILGMIFAIYLWMSSN